MSLENQIANLVDAANNLTGEVAGKMRQIDNLVDAATQAVPDAVASMMSRKWYVDAQNGDDNNQGTEAQPFKTFAKALKSNASGSSSIINIKNGQVHFFDESAIYIRGQHISLRPWGSQLHGIPELRFGQRKSSDSIHPYGVSKVDMVNSSMEIEGVKVVHPASLEGYKRPSSNDAIWNSIFQLFNSSLVFDYINGVSSSVVLGDDVNSCIASSQRGVNSVVLANVTIQGRRGVVVKNRYGGFVFIRKGSYALANRISLYPTHLLTQSIISADYII